MVGSAGVLGSDGTSPAVQDMRGRGMALSRSVRTRGLTTNLLLVATACSVVACDGWGTGLGRRAGTPKAIGRLPPIIQS